MWFDGDPQDAQLGLFRVINTRGFEEFLKLFQHSENYYKREVDRLTTCPGCSRGWGLKKKNN